LTRSQRLETGTRAVAIVLAFPWGDEHIFIRDEPFSSLSPSQRSAKQTQHSSTE
jgi:ABC-type proline/glycine betaine transport system ATPase subunit